MDRKEFTDSELIQALINALELDGDDNGFITSEDIALALDWGVERTRRQLRKLKREGSVEVGRVRRTDLSGRIQPVPAYRLKGAKQHDDGQ